MPSPFPGMDPYLEDPAFWSDFHLTFLTCWRDTIADVLPEQYEARFNESVNLVQMSPDTIKLVYPDIAVRRGPRKSKRTSSAEAGTLLLEPVTIPHELLQEVRQARIEILHRPERSLVSVIEMLSPWNKTGAGFHEYRAKRKVILEQTLHLVELDLLLAGDRLPHREPLPEGDYYVYVSRAQNRPNCDVYAWRLRDALPVAPIPLRSPDPDMIIDLQKVFATAYERGRYAPSLKYGAAPSTVLSKKDRLWVMQRGRP